MTPSKAALTDIEQQLKDSFSTGKRVSSSAGSDARTAPRPARLDQLLLPQEERGPLPLTKEKYLVRESQELVQWEREIRVFLRKLSPQHEHRVSAVMIYEWVTGTTVADVMAAGGSAKRDLTMLNKILKEYFGNPYMTYINSKKVPKAYKVPGGYYITRHRPKTLTLWVEYSEGTLVP